ncbi:MAG: IscS subfamily cysteine desulfurase [Pseudomonadota bacterium]
MQQPIYLDYAATTPVDTRVVSVMTQCLSMEDVFGNPASAHVYGQQASLKIDIAREQVALLIGAEAREIIWTSGATEANNLAIKGVANFYKNKDKRHIITMKTEHKSVLDVCQFLEKQDFEITYLSPNKNGLLELEDFKQALRADTLLVSIMLVNNETGVIQPIQAIAEIVKANNSFFHVDAAQALGKLPIDLKTLPVDLMSFSGHKIYGPKGVGALFVRRRPVVRLQALMHGGGHEQGLRSGTLPTHQIVGMGEACAILQEKMSTEIARIEKMKDRFWQGIKSLPGIGMNGDPAHSVCHILNVHFDGVDSDVLMKALPQLAISSGSACTSLSVEPSHVLQAMGLSDALAHSSLRFSFGRYTTQEEIDEIISIFSGFFHFLCSN